MAKQPVSKRKKSAMGSVVLFHNSAKASAVRAVKTVRTLVESQGVIVHMADRRGLAGHLESCDLAIAIGGDGTMLSTGREIAGFSVPLLGINTGGLGFLTAVDLPGFRKEYKRILDKGYSVERRWMLSGAVLRGGKTLFGPHTALNECVIRSTEHSRPIKVEVEYAGRLVTSFFGDGIMISTPTGSTAYALSVGGPVVMPGVDAFLVAPICSHSLTQRPLVLSAQSSISVRLALRSLQDKPKALVSLDGQLQRDLTLGEEVHIRRHQHQLSLVLPPNRTHFQLLRAKLKWGER